MKTDVRLVIGSESSPSLPGGGEAFPSGGGASIPVEFSMPFTLKETRGTEPFMFKLAFSEEAIARFPVPPTDGDGMECAFAFTAPSTLGAGTSSCTWGGWYIVRIEPARGDDNLRHVSFADKRWVLAHKRVSASYNVRWPDGTYRPESLDPTTGQPWKAFAAIRDALGKFGLDANQINFDRANGNKAPDKETIPLPDNLGNNPAGGYEAGAFSDILDPMLECVDCDMTARNGRIFIIDRSGDVQRQIQKWRQMPRLADTVGDQENEMEKPRRLRVLFPVRCETAIELSPQSTGTTIFMREPVNVIPTPEMEDRRLSELYSAAGLDAQFVNLNELLNTRFGFGDSSIARNYFKKEIIPILRGGGRAADEEITEDPNDPTQNAVLALEKMWYNAMLRQFWRRYWRIQFPTSSTNAAGDLMPTLRHLSGIRLGRLTAGGETHSANAVFADWSERLTYAAKFARVADPFSAVFSRNHPFNPEIPAPFSALWVSQKGGELIFDVRPNEVRVGQEEIFPGLFASELNYGNWFSVHNDGFINTEIMGALRSPWQFRVFASGRMVSLPEGVQSPTTIGTFDGRMFVIEEPFAAGEGSIDTLDLRVANTTANFAFTHAQVTQTAVGGLMGKFPEALLNQQELLGIFERLRQKWVLDYNDGMAGGLSFPGIDAALQGGTGGACHEFSIVVGDPDPWSIKCQAIILSSGPIDMSHELAGGKTPNLIEQD